MTSKYLEQNTLHISDPIAIEKLHSLFKRNEKSKPPASRYQKSNEEVMEFLNMEKSIMTSKYIQYGDTNPLIFGGI